MLIHSVYFWLKEDITDDEVRAFEIGAESLLDIESVAAGYFGEPAPTESRPIIEQSYDYGLVVIFNTVEDHDSYQTDPVHDAFRELSDLWTRVRIYDVEE